jgi:L-arabinokinase
MIPSYRIVFYVSGHGFGHTSRPIAVISALLRARPDAHVFVKTSAPRQLFARVLQERCDLIELQCDAGMVQIDSLTIDTADSIRRAREFQARLPAIVAAEAAYLRNAAADVVVGDIPPLAAAVAHAAGIPSVLIGNFTWDWIYEAYQEVGVRDLAQEIRAIYQRATIVLRLPMAGGFSGLEHAIRDIPFVARHSSRTQDEVRRALGLPSRADGKPLVLMSFGGYGLAGLDTAALARLTDYTIATTDSPSANNAIRPEHGLLFISETDLHHAGLRYEDLVRGADVIVTKPGYGIISEAIANGAALLYTSRGHFVEYDVLVKEMPRYLRVQFIAQHDLLKGNWSEALEKLLNQPAPPETPQTNGADIAAAQIFRQG